MVREGITCGLPVRGVVGRQIVWLIGIAIGCDGLGESSEGRSETLVGLYNVADDNSDLDGSMEYGGGSSIPGG